MPARAKYQALVTPMTPAPKTAIFIFDWVTRQASTDGLAAYEETGPQAPRTLNPDRRPRPGAAAQTLDAQIHHIARLQEHRIGFHAHAHPGGVPVVRISPAAAS